MPTKYGTCVHRRTSWKMIFIQTSIELSSRSPQRQGPWRRWTQPVKIVLLMMTPPAARHLPSSCLCMELHCSPQKRVHNGSSLFKRNQPVQGASKSSAHTTPSLALLQCTNMKVATRICCTLCRLCFCLVLKRYYLLWATSLGFLLDKLHEPLLIERLLLTNRLRLLCCKLLYA